MTFLQEMILTLGVLILSSVLAGKITELFFGKREKIKAMPYPPGPLDMAEPMYTTDIIPTKDTAWLTREEFFGKEH